MFSTDQINDSSLRLAISALQGTPPENLKTPLTIDTGRQRLNNQIYCLAGTLLKQEKLPLQSLMIRNDAFHTSFEESFEPYFATALAVNTSLQHLQLPRMNAVLLEGLCQNTSLESLDISYATYGEISATEFVYAVSNKPKLVKLNLVNQPFTQSSSGSELLTLLSLPSIMHVDLSITRLMNFQDINIRFARMSAQASLELPFCFNFGNNLTSLSLRGVCIEMDSHLALFASISDSKSLTTIDLHGSLKSHDKRTLPILIGRMLEKNHVLTRLTISGNDIVDIPFKRLGSHRYRLISPSIIAGLRVNVALKSFVADGLLWHKRHYSRLGDALSDNFSLTNLTPHLSGKIQDQLNLNSLNETNRSCTLRDLLLKDTAPSRGAAL